MVVTSGDAPLSRLLAALLEADTLCAIVEIVERHPELLTDRAQHLLDLAAKEVHSRGEVEAEKDIRALQRFLRRSKEVGVVTAAQEEVAAERPDAMVVTWADAPVLRLLSALFGASAARKIMKRHPLVVTSGDAPLLRLLETLFGADTLSAAGKVVKRHPELLTDRAEYLLDLGAEAIHSQGEAELEEMEGGIRGLQNFLRRSREVGVATAVQEATEFLQ